eukprot:COSAG04_NODE_302_length_17393_cov_6.251417_11_plen_77_part_00
MLVGVRRQVPRNYIAMQHNKSLQTEVNGMITFLDDSVGNVSAALKGTGLWDQTLLVYSPVRPLRLSLVFPWDYSAQ